MCVCERERKRERERGKTTTKRQTTTAKRPRTLKCLISFIYLPHTSADTAQSQSHGTQNEDQQAEEKVQIAKAAFLELTEAANEMMTRGAVRNRMQFIEFNCILHTSITLHQVVYLNRETVTLSSVPRLSRFKNRRAVDLRGNLSGRGRQIP